MVPLPPPWAGVEQISQILVSTDWRPDYQIDVIKSNVRDSNARKGVWDFQGVSRVGILAGRLFMHLLLRRPSLVYLTLSQNGAGLSRDLLYILICLLFRVPVVAHLHGSQLHVFLESLSSWRRQLVVAILRRTDKILVCAEAIRRDLVLYFQENKIEVVYNALPDEQPFAEKTWPLPTFDVGFMGHLSRAKGFYDVVLAMRSLSEKKSSVKLVAAGERLDNERNVKFSEGDRSSPIVWDNIEQVIALHPGHFEMKGIVTGDDKRKFFEQCAAFVLVSYAEAFPVAVLEAMAAGLPLIITPVGVLPEILIEGINALFVRPGDVAGIASAIEKLKNDPALCARMSTANKLLSAQFTQKKFRARTKDVFDNCF